MNETKSNSVGADAKGTPFFRDSFGETNNGCFCCGVIGLTHVSMKTCGRGDIDNGAVFAFVTLPFLLLPETMEREKRGSTLTRK